MDFRHIRAFIAVADALSVTKAAARLHITQPPLTRHIHQLERELGCTLFVRHRHGVTLTPAGQLLLERARQLDAAAVEFVGAARSAGDGGIDPRGSKSTGADVYGSRRRGPEARRAPQD